MKIIAKTQKAVICAIITAFILFLVQTYAILLKLSIFYSAKSDRNKFHRIPTYSLVKHQTKFQSVASTLFGDSKYRSVLNIKKTNIFCTAANLTVLFPDIKKRYKKNDLVVALIFHLSQHHSRCMQRENRISNGFGISFSTSYISVDKVVIETDFRAVFRCY